ncbi:hypothetical protein PM082_012452 [Marasmius tenuissimus]|nr:hypothetical protein PM082_012452 [Marasmius tenuissimus]
MYNTTNLFPAPIPLIARNASMVSPGVTKESTEELLLVLQENHKKHHAFFDDRGFHNHLIHRALALWALGADKVAIRQTFEIDSKIQQPRFESPESIVPENFIEHLGDTSYYDAYLIYFTAQLNDKPAAQVIEEHIFSSSFNFARVNKNGESPEMLCRLLDVLVHSMIHVGYGVEFGIVGVIAEGKYVKPPRADGVIPHEIAYDNFGFSRIISAGLFTPTVDQDDKMTGTIHDDAPLPDQMSLHAFSVLARILKDGIPWAHTGFFKEFPLVMERQNKTILRLTDRWSHFDEANKEAVDQKIEELVWMNTLLYAVSGYCTKGKVEGEFNADFFTMHLVTSLIFLPSLVAVLSPPAGKLLLRTYFSVSLATWIARGKPSLNNRAFFSDSIPSFDSPLRAPRSADLTAEESGQWSSLIEYSISHPDDHFVKIIRTLSHYASKYGSRKKLDATELEGAETVDRTLFLRAALLTAKRVVELRQLGKEECWDRPGYYE